ncbi:GxxExxY protein [Chitinophaga dinghuensis]|uniref:GxxExxY protein n=1 Tax=Chitinophaga dinghuensis TaxID=1539050 RepID=A0A327VM79_9BACT|nr:GxxExxY protein [Chitinophaga dinghuensis]RAJ73980.1 GxxExxY protein [Chitinophaga dinghuensis]
MSENEISKEVVVLCYYLHQKYGPGLFESVYQQILVYELRKKGFHIQEQAEIDIEHEGIIIPKAFKADIIINNKVIIELKSVKQLEEIHFKQLYTYLKLTNLKLGLLINFNVKLIKEGIRRVVYNI